jgi:type IV pilus assembly protein PilN
MIKINLIEQKKALKLPVILGIDLALINFKAIILVYILYRASLGFLETRWEKKYLRQEKKVTKLRKELSQLKKETKGNESIRAMLEAFDKQVDKLKQRTVQVEKIINQKQNPKMLLQMIATVLPEDVWFTDLSISKENKVEISGKSSSYKSIGDFLNSVKESAFFGKTLRLVSSDTKNEKLDGREVRIENFKIEGKILDYGQF